MARQTPDEDVTKDPVKMRMYRLIAEDSPRLKAAEKDVDVLDLEIERLRIENEKFTLRGLKAQIDNRAARRYLIQQRWLRIAPEVREQCGIEVHDACIRAEKVLAAQAAAEKAAKSKQEG